jgi:hypothetical protein
MGWNFRGARALALGGALFLIGAAPLRAQEPSELLQQDLIVTRVQRGVFPEVKLWLLPAASESLRIGPSENAPAKTFVAVPDFFRSPSGAITNLKHPRNIRNIGAYYLEVGDKVFCAKATYQAKTGRWVLDSIQRIADQPAPRLVRGRRRVLEDPLDVQIVTDKRSYRPGESIRLTLRARNRTQKPMTLLFPSGETHAMSITGGFREVWRLSTLDQSTPQPKKVTLKPGEAVEFTEVWDQVTIEKTPAEPGRYFASGKVISEGRAILPDTRVTFRIKPPAGQTNADAGGGG